MKTTTKTAALNRLDKVKVSKTSIAYLVVRELLGAPVKPTAMVEGNRIRPVYTSGKGRYISNQDHTREIQKLLETIGIWSVLTNDSPRGGLTGNLLTVTTKIRK